MTTLFVADIGGTKSELAIFHLTGPVDRPLLQKRYANAEFTGLEEIIEQFFTSGGFVQVPQFACLAVAGVVDDGKVTMTNLPWVIDSRRLAKQFGFQRMTLINDLTAVCSALAMLVPGDLLQIQAGRPQGSIYGVVAPGTGLGEGLLVDVGGQMFACGSEGGHTDFAPIDEEQVALLCWMQKKTQPVSYEMLIAGPGLGFLYDFCLEYHNLPESAWIVAAMEKVQDRIPVIIGGVTGGYGATDTARHPPCPLCRRVIDLFLSILGSEAGNLALKLYARRGIYLGGGILPRLVGHVDFAGFLKNFQAKGHMAELMRSIPVFLILRKDAALIGALGFARQELKARTVDGG
jgi:glucokinase